jgi:signal transduction histidine kinase
MSRLSTALARLQKLKPAGILSTALSRFGVRGPSDSTHAMALAPTSLGLTVAAERQPLATPNNGSLEAGRRAQAPSPAIQHLAFDALDSLVIALDQGLRVVRLNRAAALTLGLDPEHALGVPLGDIQDREPWRSALKAALSSITTSRTETGLARDTDTGTTQAFSAAPLTDADGTRMSVVSIRDVSWLVRLQREADRTQRLSELEALVGGVAHEVRNQLFSITANVDLLTFDRDIDPALQPRLDSIRADTGRLSTLVNDLLEFGKPPPPRPVRCAVAVPIMAAVERARPLVERQGVTLVAYVPPDLPAMELDISRMERAIENVLLNAARRSPAGGRVELLVSADPISRRVACRITDAGPGFPASNLEDVFLPFFRLRPGQSGLGLSLTRRVVEDHQGTVSAQNAPEGGGVILISLPVSS